MSDLDTLIVTFQTQLSDVMETVVKTAMYEVTRLVEDGFLEEMFRRDREMESLRMQLQWAERKLSDREAKEGERSGRCVECATDDMELSSDTAEEQQDDIIGGSCLKEEGDCVEGWALSCTQEESKQAAENPVCTLSPDRKSQTEEEEDVLEAVDVKEEEAIKPSCSSVHWSGSHDTGPESHGATEMTEARLSQTPEDTEELLGEVLKQDLQVSAAYVLPEEQDEMHVATDPALEVDNDWAGLTVTAAGLLQCDPAKTRSLLKQTEHELSDSDAADVDVQVTQGRDQVPVCVSPKLRLQNTDVLGVSIKQELIDDSDECLESQPKEKKTTRFGMASFSRSVKQHRTSSESFRQNHISHKAAVQEVMKLHSKVSTGLRLQAAIHHLHRPTKRLPHSHLSSTTAVPTAAQAHVANPLSRTPSTSKVVAPPPLSAQRAHLGDKQAAAHNRTGAPWVSIKMHQSPNSHHSSASSHQDSHLHAGARHILRCGQCGKCFPHPSNLKAHLQTHTGERPFCCSLCGRSFTKLSNLKAHRRVHTGERPYCCLACGKRFTQKCNLKRHQRIHLDV